MSYNVRLSEQLAIVARIKPQSVTKNNTVLSDAIDMQNHKRIMAIFNMGDYAAGDDGSVTVKLTAATTSNGTYYDVIGKSLTTANFTGSANDNAAGVIELTQEELAAALGSTYRYVKLDVFVANKQNLTMGAIVLGDYSRYSPASEYDLTAVKEIVA